MRTSFHHQPEAQHQISSYQHAGPADYPICAPQSRHAGASPALPRLPAELVGISEFASNRNPTMSFNPAAAAKILSSADVVFTTAP
jgi:hypothetical protein